MRKKNHCSWTLNFNYFNIILVWHDKSVLRIFSLEDLIQQQSTLPSSFVIRSKKSSLGCCRISVVQISNQTPFQTLFTMEVVKCSKHWDRFPQLEVVANNCLQNVVIVPNLIPSHGSNKINLCNVDLKSLSQAWKNHGESKMSFSEMN